MRIYRRLPTGAISDMENPAPCILVVDDDPLVAETMSAYLMHLGYRVSTALSGAEALQRLDEAAHGGSGSHEHDPPMPAVMLADISMPGMDGLELIRRVRKKHPPIVPVVVTGYGTIELAVKAVRLGAIDFLTKPVVDEELRIAIEKAFQQHTLVAENSALRQQLDQRYGLDNIVGTDSRMCRIFDLIEAVAPSKTTVLMCGESGTGKSLIARAIHRRSPRKDKAFVEISCGSIPDTLLESELFGHVKGAFTGAHADKQGRFVAADGGTLFLDEINSASPGMQLKLLRVLQERKFEPVGSNETIEVDVRVVLASNQPLEELVAQGEFRQDLYYRINVVMINLPPLRDRLADIPVLADHLLAAKAKDAGKQVVGFTAEAINALRGYTYPGNVRELENIIERAVVLTKTPRIDAADLPQSVIDNAPHAMLAPPRAAPWPGARDWQPMPLRKALEEPERQIILAALEANDWNRQRTAEQLDINRTTLYKKIKQYGLEELGRAG
jgi:DNA-binding NtrC family response regulator